MIISIRHITITFKQFNFIILSILFSLLQSCNHKTQERKLSHEIEINFVNTAKRGIKAPNGFIYILDSDNQTLVAFDSAENILWKVNVIDECGEPNLGQARVRHLKLEEDILEITFGKHDFAKIESKTGRISCLGAD